jgi:hypothetical protein
MISSEIPQPQTPKGIPTWAQKQIADEVMTAVSFLNSALAVAGRYQQANPELLTQLTDGKTALLEAYSVLLDEAHTDPISRELTHE